MSATSSLAWAPAWRLRELIDARALSPVELVSSCLERIERLEPSIHAFITLMADEALAVARALESVDGAGKPLLGIPVVLKDDIWVRGVPCTAGSKLLENFVPAEDSVVAMRLRDAGAIILGKTNLPEFASFLRSVSLLAEDCRNPWDLSRTSGGSSGGSAAAVASGMVPIAIGSDGGGSVRLPAAFCGAVGMIASKAVVSGYGSITYGHCTLGPITRDVRDAAIVLSALAGADPRDPWSEGPASPDFASGLERGVEGMRLAWSSDLGFVEPGDARVVDVAREAAAALVELGASLDEPDDAATGEAVGRAYSVARNGAAAHGEGPVLYRATEEWLALMEDPDKRAMLCPYDQESGHPPPRLDYDEAIEVRRKVSGQLERLFSRYDVLLTPTIAELAPPIEERLVWPFPAWHYTAYTNSANFCGLPAISIPAGRVDGKPVGLHALGPAGSEALLLRLARALETHRPWSHPDL